MNAYYNSLCTLMDSGYHSIAFPLISSGIFGGKLKDPVAESTKQCLRAYTCFTEDYPDYEIDVKLCAYTAEEMQNAQAEYDRFDPDDIDFDDFDGDMEFDAEEQAIIDAAVEASVKEVMEEYDKIEKTW